MSKAKQQSTGTTGAARSVSRDTFVTTLGAFTATVGSAIGLGNIWKFPFLTGSNGGAAFVLAYLLCVLLVGIPIMIAEHAIGRRTRMNAVRAYATVKSGEPAWAGIGYAGLVAAILIMAFYTDVAGWVFAYVFKSIAAFATGTSLTPETFGALAGGTWEPLLWQTGVMALAAFIVASGVSKGIERVTKFLMPVLLILLLVCDVRALTLPGAWAGVEYLFAFDLSKVTGGVILAALGLAFFKLSLGMGTMTTYGSYLPDQTRIIPNATRVALADTVVSLLAGLAIFPAVFAFGGQPAGGPGLLFNTIPMIFSQMPGGGLFTALFFILASIATIGAMVSLTEVPVAWLAERKKKVSRPVAALITAAVMLALGVLATLSQSPVLSGVKIFGLSFFDLFDMLSSNIILPIGGLAIALVAGWRMAGKDFAGELDKGFGQRPWYTRVMIALVKFLAPVLILLIFLSSLKII